MEIFDLISKQWIHFNRSRMSKLNQNGFLIEKVIEVFYKIFSIILAHSAIAADVVEWKSLQRRLKYKSWKKILECEWANNDGSFGDVSNNSSSKGDGFYRVSQNMPLIESERYWIQKKKLFHLQRAKKFQNLLNGSCFLKMQLTSTLDRLFFQEKRLDNQKNIRKCCSFDA